MISTAVDIEQTIRCGGNIVRQHSLEEYPLGVYFEGIAKMITSEGECGQVAGLFKNRLHKLPSAAPKSLRSVFFR